MNGGERVDELLVVAHELSRASIAGEATRFGFQVNRMSNAIARDLDRDIRWRPIAEAPKDGTWVLVCGPGGKYEPRIAVAQRHTGGWHNADHVQISSPTHFAFLTPPEEP